MAERKVVLVLLSCSKKGNAHIDAIILLSRKTWYTMRNRVDLYRLDLTTPIAESFTHA